MQRMKMKVSSWSWDMGFWGNPWWGTCCLAERSGDVDGEGSFSWKRECS